MEEFLTSIEASLREENWYAALITSLAVPDICGWLEDPSKGSGERYEKWFNENLRAKYSTQGSSPAITYVFLSGNDCYALRCSLLHQGGDDISDQRAQESVNRFHFMKPNRHRDPRWHLNEINNVLQLQVDVFCRDVADAGRTWLENVNENAAIVERMKSLLTIQTEDNLPSPQLVK